MNFKLYFIAVEAELYFMAVKTFFSRKHIVVMDSVIMLCASKQALYVTRGHIIFSAENISLSRTA